MKGTLIFNLPEEEEEFEAAQKAMSTLCAIEEFDNWLRAMFKYEDKEVVSIVEARQKLSELLREYHE